MKYLMELIWKIIKFYVKWHPCLTIWWIFWLVFCVWSGSKCEKPPLEAAHLILKSSDSLSVKGRPNFSTSFLIFR